MENVADALKMAAGVLVFVMALGIAISSFSEAKQTADILIQYNDREYSTQYAQDTGNSNRIVGVETIVPTIFRAYKEKYKIVFYDENGDPIPLFQQWNFSNNTYENVNYIDLEAQNVLTSERYKYNFIMILLYGEDAKLKNLDGQVVDNYYDNFIDEIEANSNPPLFKFDLNPQGIYGKIERESFYEYFGVYYQKDIKNTDTDDSDTEIDDTYQTSTPNKDKARVITYSIKELK